MKESRTQKLFTVTGGLNFDMAVRRGAEGEGRGRDVSGVMVDWHIYNTNKEHMRMGDPIFHILSPQVQTESVTT